MNYFFQTYALFNMSDKRMYKNYSFCKHRIKHSFPVSIANIRNTSIIIIISMSSIIISIIMASDSIASDKKW